MRTEAQKPCSELCVTSDGSYYGLPAVVLENRFLRLVILPAAGGRLWQITYKPFNSELLWNNPEIAPARLRAASVYDDVWSGGWDELFPNDEVAVIDGRSYPDHGELWTGEWSADTFHDAHRVGVRLRYVTPISLVEFEKTVLLGPGPRIDFHHRLLNRGGQCFPFLWKLHPAMAVSRHHRIDFPKMKVLIEPAFLGTLSGAREASDWPIIQTSQGNIDLRRVTGEHSRQLYFFYGTEMHAGWCAITNTSTGLACGVQFDPRIFPCCWLFATYGGWRNYNVAVLEPSTGYPLNFDAMKAAGRHRVIAPGETLETNVRFLVQEGMRSVGAIDASGELSEAS
ncbi:MAG: hypothetical protein J2P13_03925 [Acidobacteria bacterium]|nr:hypothetical protein [Acidobacteriota bacterium]